MLRSRPGELVVALALLGGCVLAGCDSAPPATTPPAHSAVAAGALPATSTRSAPAATGASLTVQASVSRCGDGWQGGPAGHLTFTVHNTDSRSGEVALTEATTDAIVALIEPLGPGASGTFSVDLTGGTYHFRCAMEDEEVLDGPAVPVTGRLAGTPSPAVKSVTQQDLIPASQAYQAYVLRELPGLAAATTKLAIDVSHDDRAAAESDWLAAHLDYERLGAAYGAFGDIDAAINGLPNGLPDGVEDPDFTGFHRVEYGLWHRESTSKLRTVANQLNADVKGLQKVFASAQIDPLEVSIRAHEITENALQFSLTGEDDFGSHSGLATISANLDGTATVLDLLRPLLTSRYLQLSELTGQLTRARVDIAAQHHDGRWSAVDALPRPQREKLTSDVAELTELLAPVASILEPRRF